MEGLEALSLYYTILYILIVHYLNQIVDDSVI